MNRKEAEEEERFKDIVRAGFSKHEKYGTVETEDYITGTGTADSATKRPNFGTLTNEGSHTAKDVRSTRNPYERIVLDEAIFSTYNITRVRLYLVALQLVEDGDITTLLAKQTLWAKPLGQRTNGSVAIQDEKSFTQGSKASWRFRNVLSGDMSRQYRPREEHGFAEASKQPRPRDKGYSGSQDLQHETDKTIFI